MAEVVVVAGIIIGWLMLQLVILPRMGVST
jgi:hypothetical protein